MHTWTAVPNPQLAYKAQGEPLHLQLVCQGITTGLPARQGVKVALATEHPSWTCKTGLDAMVEWDCTSPDRWAGTAVLQPGGGTVTVRDELNTEQRVVTKTLIPRISQKTFYKWHENSCTVKKCLISNVCNVPLDITHPLQVSVLLWIWSIQSFWNTWSINNHLIKDSTHTKYKINWPYSYKVLFHGI